MEKTINMETSAAVFEDVKPYVFRKLEAPDVFLMFKIISAIGVNEFTACFEKDGIKNLIEQVTKEGAENSASLVGVSVLLEIANVVFGNIPKAEKDIYKMLSQTSNLTVEQVKSLDAVTFSEMVIDFIKKEEFADFIKVVSKLFK